MKYGHPVPVTVNRTGGRDPKGNPLPGTEHDLQGCFIAPRSSEEPMDRSDTVVTGAVLRGPWPVDLHPTDTLTIPDGYPLAGRWSIVGEVGPYRSPFSGWTPGFRVALSRGA